MSDAKPGPSEPSPIIWTPSQRRVLLVFLLLFGFFLTIRYARNRKYLSDQFDAPPPRASDLADRIDPNIADWQTLAAIPSLGEKRAQLIVKYREKFFADHPHESVAFHSADDLSHVKGIGASTAANLAPYLDFPTATVHPHRPATTP